MLDKEESGYTPDAQKTITPMTIIHVGDIIYTGNAADFAALDNCLRVSKHGSWGNLTESASLTYCGVKISLNRSRHVELPPARLCREITRDKEGDPV